MKKQLVDAVRGVDLDQLPASRRQKAQSGTKAVRQIPLTPQIARIANRIIWFEPPATAVCDPVRFIAYAMDMKVIRRYVSGEDFLEALDQALRGSST